MLSKFYQSHQRGLSGLYASLFFRPNENTPTRPNCWETAIGTLSGGFLTGIFSLAIFSLINGSVTPWLLLVAAPYIILGACLGYAAAQSLSSSSALLIM